MAIKPAPEKNHVIYADRYRVVSTLGAGGMATVYLAMDQRLDRLVAVKVIHSHLHDNKTLIERFKIEARTVASLHSPYIVEIHDFGIHEGNLFFVMEYIDGQTLNWILDRLNLDPMDPDVAAALVCQIAEGLTVVVQPGIVHRDLKPENILISSQGYLKITDFGIVYLKGNSKLTATGQVLGTPKFMSPEQVEGKREITHQSDLFSLGVIFYYCLTGRLPFQSDSVHSIMFSIVEDPHRPIRSLLPEIDPHLELLVETLLQKDPSKRGAGAHWLQAELKKYLFKRQVVDPVARIRTYIAELGERGIQTLREIDWLDVKIERDRQETQKQIHVAASRSNTFLSPMTRMFDKKSKWLWGIGLFLIAILGFLGQYFLRVQKVQPHKVISSAPITKVVAQPKPPLQETMGTDSVTPKLPEIYTTQQNPVMPQPAPSKAPVISNPRQPSHVSANTLKSSMATISATSSPPFAEVKLETQSLGYCPLRNLKISPGQYKVRVSWRNSRSIDTVIKVVAGENIFQFNEAKE